jgi:hypothetical protein
MSEQNEEANNQLRHDQLPDEADQHSSISAEIEPEQDNELFPPTSPRRRTRPILFAVIIVLLVVIIVGIASPLRNAIFSSFSPATPIPSPTFQPEAVSFTYDPHMGSVTVNGHPYQRGTTLHLSVGKYQIVWRGEPFQPITCTLVVPYSPTLDTCGNYENRGDTSDSEQLTFFPDLSYLSKNEQASLLSQIQASLGKLQASDTVYPGEQYALLSSTTQLASPAKATTLLHATLSFHLDTDPHSTRQCGQSDSECGLNGQNCHLFCTSLANYVPATSTAFHWNVIALLYSQWDYTAANGKSVAKSQPDSISSVTGTEQSIHLSLTWTRATNTWHVSPTITSGFTPPGGDPLSTKGTDLGCADAQDLVTSSYGVTQQSPATTLTWQQFAIGSNRAAGCLAVAQSDTSSHVSPAYFLYRFGVLLAANMQAHQYFPNIPLVDSYEQGIAQSIAGQHHL